MGESGTGTRRAQDFQFRRHGFAAFNGIERRSRTHRIAAHNLMHAFGKQRIAHGIGCLAQRVQFRFAVNAPRPGVAGFQCWA